MAHTIELDEETYASLVQAAKERGLEPTELVAQLVETNLSTDEKEPVSVLDVAMSLNLDGPPDWSRNIDHYLYGHPKVDE